MLNLLSMYLLKMMLIVSGLHVTAMVALFQLANVATMSIRKWIKMAMHMALENGVAKIAISTTAAKKILLFVMCLLSPPSHAPSPFLQLPWFQM